jgi:single-strand DNA-binding protein
MINKVTLIGRLGKDPEVRTLEGGAMVARFSVATSESYKDKSDQWVEQIEWHQIVAWRDLAKRAGDQLRKGMLIYIEGKLTYRTWKDTDGKDRMTTEIVANSYRLLAKPDNHHAQAETTQNATNDHSLVSQQESDNTPF